MRHSKSYLRILRAILMHDNITITTDEVTPCTNIAIARRSNGRVRDDECGKVYTISSLCRHIASAHIRWPDWSVRQTQFVRIVCHSETDPVARHDSCKSLVLHSFPIEVRIRKVGSCGAVESSAGIENHLVDGRRVAVVIDSRGGD